MPVSTIDNERRAWRVWEILKTKYNSRLKTQGRELIQQFVSYKMDASTTISEAWSTLAKLGQEISVTHPSSRYHLPDERLQQLLSALTDEYRFVRQTIDLQGVPNVDEVLLRLKEEERLLRKHQDTGGLGRDLSPRTDRPSGTYRGREGSWEEFGRHGGSARRFPSGRMALMMSCI